MLDNSYKITTNKITFHTPFAARLILFVIGAPLFAAMCWFATVLWAGRRLLTPGDGWLLVPMLLFIMASCIIVVGSAFTSHGYLDLQKMSYEGFTCGLFLFPIRKITVPRQEMRSVIVLYRQKYNHHGIVIVCSRPVTRLAALDNPAYVNYIFLTSSRNRPEAEYLAQRVADCFSLPYFGIQDHRKG